MPVPKSPPTPPTQAAGGGGSIWKKFGAGNNGGDDDRVTWRSATEGDTITFTLNTEPREVNTRYGPKCVIDLDAATDVVVGAEAAEDGDYSFGPTPGPIDSFDTAGVVVGDKVRLTLVKLIETGRGNPFKAYEAEVIERDGASF